MKKRWNMVKAQLLSFCVLFPKGKFFSRNQTWGTMELFCRETVIGIHLLSTLKLYLLLHSSDNTEIQLNSYLKWLKVIHCSYFPRCFSMAIDDLSCEQGQDEYRVPSLTLKAKVSVLLEDYRKCGDVFIRERLERWVTGRDKRAQSKRNELVLKLVWVTEQTRM